LEKIHHTITSNQIEEIYNNLADAKNNWTSNVGEAEKIWVPGDPYSGGGSMELKPGKKNELIHNVTQDLGWCLRLCLNIKQELTIIKENGPPTYVPTPVDPMSALNRHPAYVPTPVDPMSALNRPQTDYEEYRMSSKSFDDYKIEFEQMLQDIISYSYENKNSKNDTHALNTLQQKCKEFHLHSLYRLNQSFHALFTGNTADILGKFKNEIERAQQAFTKAAGEAQYDYKSLPNAWHEGYEKILKPGAKNEMLGAIHSKIQTCIFYIQCMIDIKSTEERAATSTQFDTTPKIKMLLYRLINI